MRISARPNIRTAASLSAATVLLGGLPLVTAATVQAVDTPTPSTTQVLTKKQIKAQKKRARIQRAKQRASRERASLVRVGLNQLGNQYVAGGAGPRVFDCSGFTQYVYKKATGKYLPHYSCAQMNRAKRIGKKHLKPGDLLFFGPGGSQHVSMYIGKGKMVHATNPRTDVRIDSINNAYWRGRFAGAGRIIEG